MRRPALLLALLACAHVPRSTDPANWLELQSEHFVFRTDLPLDDARAAVSELERGRAALLIAAWHSTRPSLRKTVVIELANRHELEEFAVERLEGFVTGDAFDEQMMVLSADHEFGDQDVLKHELAHVITDEFLVVKPRWLAEGIACYLETLRFERFSRKLRVGDLSEQRLNYLKERPILDYAQALHTGREAESLDAGAGYSFESASWLLVHWLVDTRQDNFDRFLNRLTREGWEQAFREEFPDLSDSAIRSGMKEYWKTGSVRIASAPAPAWSGEIVEERMDRAEVYALRADLFRLSPGFAASAERKALMNAEIAKALAADPANPLALKLSGGDPRAAVAVHPRDWRSWALLAERSQNDVTSLAKAAALAPQNGPLIALLAMAESNSGRKKEGLEHALRAAQLAPGRSDVLDILAQLQAFSGNCFDAINLEQRAIDALPDSAAASAVITLNKRLSSIREMCVSSMEQR